MKRPQIQHIPPTPAPRIRYERTTAELSALLEWYTANPFQSRRMAQMEGMSAPDFQALLGRAAFAVATSTTPEG